LADLELAAKLRQVVAAVAVALVLELVAQVAQRELLYYREEPEALHQLVRIMERLAVAVAEAEAQAPTEVAEDLAEMATFA
jgi:hypothetical protein